jgi:hypothetical protein
MEVSDREKFYEATVKPLRRLVGLAKGAVTVHAGVVEDQWMSATVALVQVTTQHWSAATRESIQKCTLGKRA